MAGNLLSSIDRSLTRRARSNAAAAVRADARHAEQRREASQALTSVTAVPDQTSRDSR